MLLIRARCQTVVHTYSYSEFCGVQYLICLAIISFHIYQNYYFPYCLYLLSIFPLHFSIINSMKKSFAEIWMRSLVLEMTSCHSRNHRKCCAFSIEFLAVSRTVWCHFLAFPQNWHNTVSPMVIFVLFTPCWLPEWQQVMGVGGRTCLTFIG